MDRLARFGVEHLDATLSTQSRKVIVVDEGELEDDLVKDITEISTSFCIILYALLYTKLYGMSMTDEK
jgi:putative resolvase